MKVNLYESGGALESGGFTIPGMTLTGPLLLSGKVSSPSEAVHKQYIDTAATNLTAASFVSGTIAAVRLPGLTGDVTSANSSNNVVLNATGVIAGDYTKVTVDVKGRVTVGLSLTEADLPALSWGKITTGKPDTLAGFGITDGVSTVNGVITGNLTLSANPVAANQAATKQYADANSASGSKIVTGDIVGQASNVTASGFLRCNGGVLDKTTYSALYAVVGDAFTGGNTQPGNGQPWKQQYQFNIAQSNEITDWRAGTALPATINTATVLVTKNRVYLMGGLVNTTASNAVYTAAINSDGTLGAWTSSTALPVTNRFGHSFVTKNRVYLVCGEFNGQSNTTLTYTAPINADGTLGTWTAGPSLPSGSAYGSAFVTNGRAYVVGGYSGSIVNTIYYAPINSDGTLGAWVSAGTFPIQIYNTMTIVTNNRVYTIGGITTGSGSSQYVTAIYTCAINSDGSLGTWSTSSSFPTDLYYSQAVVVKNKVYVIGGYTSAGGYSSSVYTAPINADGTLGSWTSSTALPVKIGNGQVIVTASKVFVLGGIGGVNGGTQLSSVYYGTFAGGLNDYSSYYDGTFTPISTSNFKLPDYTAYEKTSLYFYIKS